VVNQNTVATLLQYTVQK